MFMLTDKDHICLWGGGEICKLAISWLRQYPIDISCIVDSNSNNLEETICGIPVISPEQFFAKYRDSMVVVSSERYSEEIKDTLIRNGISKYVLFSELDRIGKDNDQNRERWIIEKLGCIKKGKKILDAGAGELRFKPYCRHLEYTSQDFCQYDGSGKSGLQTGTWDTSQIDIVSDIVDIPVQNDSFDAILCSEVLEHIKNPILAIKEFSRILKTGGELILTAPFCSLTHFAPFHYCTGFSIYWYREVLKESNLIIQEETCNGNYFSYLAQELRRLESVGIMYSNYELLPRDKQLITNTLGLLERMNDSNNESGELLCYGWQVVAIKQKENHTIYSVNKN